ncbi:MAG TPA: RNA methyltransferase [Bryobacteraceae bacterium]|nr:RNA methyltransferase [Bryobacteraceae bacterium]
METELLTSPANPLVKEIRRAVARGTLTRQGYAVAEGFHLLDEALRSGCRIEAVAVSQAAREAVGQRTAALSGARRMTLAEAHFRAIASTEASQGVLTLVRPPEWGVEDLFGPQPLVVVLDGIQDPGNAGAILRAAEAFGASGAIFVKGTVSPYNPKALRASAGSVFRVPLVTQLDAEETLAALRAHGLRVYAAMPAARASIAGADLTLPCAFLIGSEGAGVGERLRAGASEVRIPVSGVESLNAALAAGVLLYEARRQRSGA